MFIDFLLEALAENSTRDAIVWNDEVITYGQLRSAVAECRELLASRAVREGAVTSLEMDFSPTAVALMMALIEHRCTVVPLTDSIRMAKEDLLHIAEVETRVTVDRDGLIRVEPTGREPSQPLLLELERRRHPGLILFTSGSTGKSKAAVHDFVPLLEKFKVPRHAFRTIMFLALDHIGGINTLLYTLANAGCVVTVQDRSPEAVCAAIETYRVQLLPTTPTFLNLLLLSEAYEGYDLGSLQLVSYGTEVMPESTLTRFGEQFPQVRLLQTYGLSELGILRSKSESSESLWVKVGGDGFETRVVDGMLEIKADSAMLGYLNAPSPFTDDGWFRTGDVVEVKGEYMRFKGRQSEIINVGGEKVYPAEVESVLQLLDGVEEVVVTGEPNPLTGQIVKARVRLSREESLDTFRKRMRSFCKDRLSRFKIPQKVELADTELHSERHKKIRNPS